MKYKVTWEEKYSQIIEADSKEKAKEIAFDLDSNDNNYMETTYQEIEEA